ncbi:oligosaccharide flippase family protein [Nitrincola schmidtii]|uniref:oligosaccharide flippase family protein n=1 Tax=Nitrincola schmidtii TaxID=1730894 RepID=UPI00124E99B7|nr:oligosaccharide flippase family protein [Nitrincola schmidtii]
MITYFKKNRLKLAALIVALDVVLGQVIRLGSNLILTRLLAPDMFGVMMIAFIFLAGISMLSDLGLKDKFIQSKNSYNEGFINTCWSMQVVRGGIISLITIVLAIILYYLNVMGFVKEDTAYSAPELPVILALISLTSLLNGFNSIAMYDHSRNLRLIVLAKIHLISQLVSTGMMLIVALYYREIWVLLIAPLLDAGIKLFLSYYYSGNMKAKFEFEKKSLKEIVSFSKWIFIGSSLGYLALNADRILLGIFLTAEELGVFSIAFMLAMAGKELFSKIVKSVAYPKLSQIARDKPSELKCVMYSLRMKIDILTYSTAGFLAGFGSIIILVLYDERYTDAGWMLEIMSLALVFVGLNVSQQALLAMSKAFSFALIHVLGTIYVIVGIPLAFHFYGIQGVILFIATKSIATMPILFYLQHKYGLLNLKREIIAFPVLIAFYYIGLYGKNLISDIWL